MPLVLTGGALDGLGVAWLSARLFTAAQEHTPPYRRARLTGRIRQMQTSGRALDHKIDYYENVLGDA